MTDANEVAGVHGGMSVLLKAFYGLSNYEKYKFKLPYHIRGDV